VGGKNLEQGCTYGNYIFSTDFGSWRSEGYNYVAELSRE